MVRATRGFTPTLEHEASGANLAKHPSRLARGFTLIELLIVIGILAILATLVILVLNPSELFKQSRDIRRLNDLKVLSAMVNYARFGGKQLGAANKRIDTSIPDSAACPSITTPALFNSWVRRCAITNDYLKLDGTGWVEVDFGNPFGFNQMGSWMRYMAAIPQNDLTGALSSKLPVDPTNTVAGDLYYMYLYNLGDFEFVANFESAKYQAKAQDDSGYDSGKYELGSSMSLWKEARNL